MKKIKIFLLILIIIGVIALLSQKIWVPKLVDKIILSEKIDPTIVSNVQQNILLIDGHQCYVYDHETTPNEPYAINEFIDMTITGAKVTGIKTGTQKGPDMNNGYNGTLIGTLNKNIITTVFSYVVEGSAGKEKETYKTSKTGIGKLRYPLIKAGGMLIPDTTKEFQILKYDRTECIPSN